MRHRPKPRLTQVDANLMRDQEVVRATRELAAYFKGRRTEREARAALKIIKAYIRGREELDPKNRPPLPGLSPAQASSKVATRKPAKPRARRRKLADPAQLSEPAATTPEE